MQTSLAPCVCNLIIGGLIIPNAEGAAWLKREHGMAIKPDHSEDLSIPWYLPDAIEAHNYPYDIEQVQPQDVVWCETLLITQWANGPFLNIGPPGVEEILQDNLKGVIKHGAREDEAHDTVFQGLGGQTPC